MSKLNDEIIEAFFVCFYDLSLNFGERFFCFFSYLVAPIETRRCFFWEIDRWIENEKGYMDLHNKGDENKWMTVRKIKRLGVGN